MNDYPAMIVPVDHIEPVPRRIRATLGGRTVFDTTRALTAAVTTRKRTNATTRPIANVSIGINLSCHTALHSWIQHYPQPGLPRAVR